MRLFAMALLVAAPCIALAGDGEIEHERQGDLTWVTEDGDGKRIVERIEIDGPRPFLGVHMGRSEEPGALIESVVDDSPAAGADLREGDRVVAFDGEPIESTWDLTRAVLKTAPGTRVELEVVRDGATRHVDVEIGERDDWGPALDLDLEGLEQQLEQLGDLHFEFDAQELGEHLEHLGEALGNHRLVFQASRPRLGVQLVDATPELREHLGARPDRGLLVGKVIDDTPAEAAGIEVGDLIVTVAGEPVSDAGELRRLLSGRDGRVFDVEVLRDGRPLVLTVTLPEREESDDFEIEPSGRPLRWHAPLHDNAPAADRT